MIATRTPGNGLVRFLMGAGLFLSACTSKPGAKPDGQRPNIVFILADDLVYSDISLCGVEIETPHLQRLADGGMRFPLMHNTSKCFPSRAELLTDTYAQQSHIHDEHEAFENSVMLGGVEQSRIPHSLRRQASPDGQPIQLGPRSLLGPPGRGDQLF